MQNLIARFAKDESGATAIEYALLAAVMGVGLYAAFNTLKGEMNTAVGKVSTQVKTW